MYERPPLAWVYGRASHDKQYAKKSDEDIEFCDSVDRQIESAKRYWEYQLKPKGVEWGGYECDDYAVSAYAKPFFQRPAALRLLNVMHDGDHLIVDKLDRIWRRSKDHIISDEILSKHGITLHIVNMGGLTVVRGTVMGDLILKIMVAMAEAESAQLSARLKATREWRIKRGLPVGGRKTFGKRKEGRKKARPGKKKLKSRFYVHDLSVRAVAQEIVRLRDKEGKAWCDISDIIEKSMCLRDGLFYYEPQFKASRKDAGLRYWNTARCQGYYGREKQLQAEEAGILK